MPTVTPSMDAEGNISGFDFEPSHEGAWRTLTDEYIQGIDGSVHHRYENVTIDERLNDGNTDVDYWEAVASLYPDTYQALSWAADNVPKELIAEYNLAIDNDDRREANRLLERIVGEYRESSETTPEEPTEGSNDDEAVDDLDQYTGTLEQEYDTLSDEDKSVVNTAIDRLIDAQPLGEDVSNQWQEAVYAYQQAGDEVGAAVCAAVAAVHDGSVTQQEAISYIVGQFPMKDVVRAYNRMNK